MRWMCRALLLAAALVAAVGGQGGTNGGAALSADEVSGLEGSSRLGHRRIFPEKVGELILRYGNRTIPDLALGRHAQHMGETLRAEVKLQVAQIAQREPEGERTTTKELMRKAVTTSCAYTAAPNDGRQLCCDVLGMVFCLPNFVIIGAQKSGTTALYAYLMHHPQIRYAKGKELHFFDFADHWNSGLRSYLNNFESHASLDHASASITGEASPSYMAMDGVCRRIRMTLPHTKIIAVLRDPVKRAWSEYQMGVRIGMVNNELKESLDEHMPQLRRCLEGGLFSTTAEARNLTRREATLRVKYAAVDLTDCMPGSVTSLEQWRLFVPRLISTSRKSKQWDSCWKSMVAEKDALAWAQLWEICTRGILRHTDPAMAGLRDDAEIFSHRLHKDAKKINHCLRMPEYDDDFMQCNENPHPSDLSGDYIWRGMFAKQLKECYRWFPRDQVLVLEQDDLRKNAEQTMGAVQDFLGLPAFDYSTMSGKDAMKLFNDVYPGFEATTGWRAKEGYGDVPEEAKRFLSEFFDEHNEELFQLLGRSLPHWSKWDPDEFQEYYYFSSYY